LLAARLTPQILPSSTASMAAAPGVRTHDESMERTLYPVASVAPEKSAQLALRDSGP
jgi:hypothetical protein